MSALDRKAHSEALIVSFIAEHSRPFTAAPSLIQLIPELAQDAKILQEIDMERAKLSYKLCDRSANHLNEKLLQDILKRKFSFNVDNVCQMLEKNFLAFLYRTTPTNWSELLSSIINQRHFYNCECQQFICLRN